MVLLLSEKSEDNNRKTIIAEHESEMKKMTNPEIKAAVRTEAGREHPLPETAHSGI